ncbi:MAG: 2-hydroxychromene-2-carboxylate isomerase [Sneathiella sp.]
MTITIDYYASIPSPWTYFGHARLCELAKKYNAKINFKPGDFGTVFSKTGGLPLAKRAPERQKYRFQELKRWREELNIDLELNPKYFPVDPTTASYMTILAGSQDLDVLTLSGAFMRAVWAENQDISNDETLVKIANDIGFDGRALLENCTASSIKSIYEGNTQEAIDRGVFGAPSYVIDDEIFWGQDRLMFVEKRLKEGS